MVLKHTCPTCRTVQSLEAVVAAAVEDVEARRLVEYLVKTYQPTLGADTLRYLRLHTPAKQRMTWSRVHKVLGELVEAMRSRKINRHGREWPVTVEDWQEAYRRVFAAQEKGALSLPLKDNGYLYAILVNLVDKSEAVAEARALLDQRVGMRESPRAAAAPAQIGAVVGRAFADAPAVAAAPAPATPKGPTDTPQLRAMREEIARRRADRERWRAKDAELGIAPAPATSAATGIGNALDQAFGGSQP